MAKTTHFLIRTFHDPGFDMSWAAESGWQPRVDVYQSDDSILIYVEAAGVRDENMKLHLENGQLIIEGERERPPLPCPQHCLQVEISYGAFRRVLPLPPDADGANIRAQYHAGILEIIVPRNARPTQNVKVEIR